jgi:hypothetical protein
MRIISLGSSMCEKIETLPKESVKVTDPEHVIPMKDGELKNF